MRLTTRGVIAALSHRVVIRIMFSYRMRPATRPARIALFRRVRVIRSRCVGRFGDDR
jgi:hypothetical protein